MSDEQHPLIRNYKSIEQRTLETLERIEAILERAFPAPGHTDLMVSPEAIDEALDAAEEGPPPYRTGGAHSAANRRRRGK